MPKPKLRLRDWLFGGAGKRQLLEQLIAEEGRAWTQTELADAAGLTPKGSVDEHLAALRQLKLVSRRGAVYRFNSSHELAKPLRDVLAVVEALPNVPLKRPR